ncbi:MAG: hypothetical protein JSS72_12440 [Armatimonadetes bacterium]|nr:hypothetical protein [Armatimonadota bacterium]
MREKLQQKIERLQAQAQKVETSLHKEKDPYVQKALQEHLSQIKSDIDKTAQRLSMLPPDAVEETAQRAAPTPLTGQQIAALDNLARQVQVAKRRGQAAQATELIRQMQQVAPESPQVLEMMGDEFAERLAWPQAKEYYEKALYYNPKSAGLEKKYANVVLRTSAATAMVEAMRAGENPLLIAKEDVVTTPKMAAAMSFFVPGTGQLLLGDPVAGGIFMGCWVFSWLLAYLMHRFVPDKPFLVIVCAGLAVLVMIIAAGACLSEGKKRNQKPTLMP